MRLSGWLFLIASWTVILSLMVFSYRIIFRKKDPS